MKKISHFVLVALLASAAIDLTGFAFGLFYAGVFYDNLAHFLTSFSLVALGSEMYLSREKTHNEIKKRITVHRALAVGAAIGLVSGVAWEGFETLLDLTFPSIIYNPPVDSAVDTAFGTLGGALGMCRMATNSGLAPSADYLNSPREKTE